MSVSGRTVPGPANGSCSMPLPLPAWHLALPLALAAFAAGCRQPEPPPTVAAAPAPAPAAAPAPDAAGPEYRCLRATDAVTVDGDIGEAAWKAAEWMDLPVVTPPKGEQKLQRTRAAAIYDDRFLYVAWDCEDSEIVATLKERDEPLWSQDCVEFFVSQRQDDGVYCEFESSPNGVLFDALVLKDPPGKNVILAWDPRKAATAAKRTADGYTVELAVPMPDMFRKRRVPPVSGDRWRGNIYRIDCGKAGAVDYAWNPVRDFHDTSKFGTIVFADPQGDRAAAEDAALAKEWLGGKDRADWWTLAEHLDQIAVSSPKSGPYGKGADGFRCQQKGGWGRLVRVAPPKPGTQADVVRGELAGHPHLEGDPVVIEAPAAGAGDAVVCYRSDPRVAKRIESGEADGVDFRVEFQAQDGKAQALATLRADRAEWLARKFSLPGAGTLRVTVNEGPDTLTCDSFRMVLDLSTSAAPAAPRQEKP